MIKLFFLILLISIIPFGAFSENSPEDSLELSNDNYRNEVDSLVNMWFNKQMSAGTDTSFVAEDFDDSILYPDFSDSVYKRRLAALPMVIDVSYNKVVSNYINMYTHKRRDLVENMLGLSDYYFPLFEELLDANGMPMELKYLPVIESALNPNAVSRVGATGMWQFMYYTGRMYKLEINSYVDERRDPVKSTYAAIHFLKDLYNIYQDWVLVIAAYNCGPGNVNKAIRRSGGKTDYWDIYYHLPRETRGYVPAFIAAAYVMNYYGDHHLSKKTCDLPIMCDTLLIDQQLHLDQVSRVMGIGIDELRTLNPQYRRDILPANGKSYVLRLPFNQTTRFIDLEDSILAFNDSVYFNAEALSKAPAYNSYTPGVAPTKNHVKIFYTVKSGDNLGYISNWYNVSVSDLRYWNGLQRNVIRSGQKLAIYIHKSKADKYRSVDDMTFAKKQALIGKTATSSSDDNTEPIEALNTGEYDLYTVRSGDTLWDIAKLYPGVTDSDIMRWNGISNARNISVGQQLKIKKKS